MQDESRRGQQTATKMVKVKLEDGTTFYVKAVVPQGEREVGLRETTTASFEQVVKAIEGIGKQLTQAWQTIKPGKASVELNFEISYDTGHVLAVLVDGSTTASMKITLEWGAVSSTGN